VLWARTPMMAKEGESSVGEAETVLVARERRIMLSGRTERGARWAVKGSPMLGSASSRTGAMVEVLRSEEWIRRRAGALILLMTEALEVGEAWRVL
jgi:hypothetical protein